MKWLMPVIYTLLLLGGWLWVAYLYIDYTLESPVRDEVVTLEIPPDSSVQKIGELLEEKNLIRNSIFFRIYAKYTDNTNLIAGVYEVNKDDDLIAILKKIASGKQDDVKITIPEGFNVYEIADVLEKRGFNKEAFLKEVDRSEAKTEIEKRIKDNEDRSFKLEGYLYPTTYNFRKDATPELIVNTMLAEFQKNWDKLDGDNLIKAGNLELDEAVIYASLVEKETMINEERPKIARVIYNRLKRPESFALNIDAATVYGIRMEENRVVKRLLDKDYAFSSPYNLYKQNPEYPESGLPPGPIANPRIQSLEAVLKPAKNYNAYFYQTKIENPAEHIFFETLAEHEAYRKKKAALQ
ncbi:endolytic transglycosylase MltG [Risungbinella massiliensis]|uniref:endolytic transglycosylase MltG n=1 Tax=Risungbinella massiliensis TaxID=1329796 RepID=UPI00069A5B75|nr:endolytic transglycosylase MltG [Risungbinella massiliensis]